jgi:thiamine-phosphate pyrophosphorylase
MAAVLTELEAVHKAARALARQATHALARQTPQARAQQAGRAPSAPVLLLLSDPVRAPGLATLAERAPPGAWIVARSWGAAPDLAGVDPQIPLLATVSPRLARTLALDGLHWPNRRLRLRRRSAVRGLTETASAHSAREAIRAGRAGIATVLVSPVFPSRSPSAGRPLGPVRLAALVRTLRAAVPGLRVLALGGITARTARRLGGTGVSGVAGVSFG